MKDQPKTFLPTLRTYNDDMSKQWRIEWYVPAPGGRIKRCDKPVYRNINKGKTVEERKALAAALIKSLRLDLPKSQPTNFLEKVIEMRSVYWRPKTVSAYTTILKKWVEYLKKVKLEKADEVIVISFLMHMKENGASKSTIFKYRNSLYTLYQYAITYKLAKENPVSKETKAKKEARSLHFFTDKQIEQFRASNIDRQLWLGMRFLFYCFIRPGEQRNMRIEWINFENRFVDIPGQWSKNGKSQKVVIPDRFFNEIKYLQQYPNSFYVLSKSGNPGTEQITTQWLNLTHKKLLDELKIRGRYAFYSWKHTGAVKAVQAGINIKDLQLQLRHHSLDMVNEYLKNLGVMDSKDLKGRFPDIFGNKKSHSHSKTCHAIIEPAYNYCPQCGAQVNLIKELGDPQ